MCNSRPVYRVGRTTNFLAMQRNASINAKNRRWLSRNEAVEVARRIFDKIDELSQSVSDSLVNCSELGPIELVAERRKDARLSFSHGVIIDFPNMRFKTSRYIHQIRVCVTVCQHGSKSKLWFRSQAGATHRNGDFASPVETSTDELFRFFDEAESLGELGLNVLLDIYGEEVQSYIDEKFQDLEAKLLPDREFRFRMFDTDRAEFRELYGRLQAGESFTSIIESAINPEDEQSHPALIAAQIALHEDSFEPKLLDRIRQDNRFEIVGCQSIYENEGILIKQLCQENEKDFEIYSGAAYDPEAGDPSKSLAESPAYRMAAEMLAGVARGQ